MRDEEEIAEKAGHGGFWHGLSLRAGCKQLGQTKWNQNNVIISASSPDLASHPTRRVAGRSFRHLRASFAAARKTRKKRKSTCSVACGVTPQARGTLCHFAQCTPAFPITKKVACQSRSPPRTPQLLAKHALTSAADSGAVAPAPASLTRRRLAAQTPV